jgi:hypothetical protein
MVDAYTAAIARMEPEIGMVERDNFGPITALTSIAISLKRIADSMEKRPRDNEEMWERLGALELRMDRATIKGFFE